AHEDTVIAEPVKVHDEGAAAGGEWLTFDDDVNEALAEFNQQILDEDWAASPLLDGAALLDRWDTAAEEWTGLVEEAGITFATIDQYDEWSQADVDWDAYFEIYNERVVIPNRPS